MECPICISAFNNSTKRSVECLRCGYKSCQNCTKTYMMQSHYEAHCMNCKNNWDRMFMATNFTNTFLTNEYKIHRSNVLFEREKSLFPETMILIELDKEMKKKEDYIRSLEENVRILEYRIQEEWRQLYQMKNGNVAAARQKEKREFVRPCSGENCKGYINEVTGVCGICSKKTCLKCNVIVEEDEHECKEEDVLNWQEISKNSKPCPNCHTRIHKISGCNQMWCPQCHVAFNYMTGKIENGVIHNPHYYDYLSQNPGHERQQNPCGGVRPNRLPEAWRVSSIKNPDSENKQNWLNFHRLLHHIQIVELPKYRNGQQDITLDLRKKYMMNEMDEKQFKKRIQERDKRNKKNTEMSQILDMFFNVGRDLLNSYVNGQGNKHVEMKNLINYVNESIGIVNYNYQSRLPIIQNFSFYS